MALTNGTKSLLMAVASAVTVSGAINGIGIALSQRSDVAVLESRLKQIQMGIQGLDGEITRLGDRIDSLQVGELRERTQGVERRLESLSGRLLEVEKTVYRSNLEQRGSR